MRLETLAWQQRVVTVRPETLVLGAAVAAFITVTGEHVSIYLTHLVWVSKTKEGTRVCYNLRVPMSGLTGCKPIKKLSNGLVEFKTGKTTIIVNPKFHKRHKE